MKNKTFEKRYYPVGIVLLLAMVFLFGAVVPAFSWTGQNGYQFVFTPNSSICEEVNGAWITGRGWLRTGSVINPVLPGVFSGTFGMTTNVSVPPAWSPAINLAPTPPGCSNCRRVKWDGLIIGPTYPGPQFTVKFGIPFPGPKAIVARFKWVMDPNGAPVDWTNYAVCPAQTITLGWFTGSPPALYNPAETEEGTANTHNMVVRNLQFAVSPSMLTGEELSLDNPVVQGLFSASQDPLRPGPFVVPPDSSYPLTLDPGITDPVFGGSTVLAKGTVEDESGYQAPFLVQFSEESQTPVGYNPQWLILTVISLMLAGGFLLRRRMARQ